MNKARKFFSEKSVAVLIFAIVFSVSLGSNIFKVLEARAQTGGYTPGNLHEYAWSGGSSRTGGPVDGTIGWVSLNCVEGGAGRTNVCSTSPYSLNINATTGNITGYAWSSHVGWLSFNQTSSTGVAEASACGSQAMVNFAATTSDKPLSGWAKFLNGNPATGWDGCVKLKSTGAEPAYGVVYRPGATGNNIIGYGWGSSVVGWLGFFGKYTPTTGAPTVDLKVNGVDASTTTPPPYVIPSAGATVTLSYTTANAVSCVASSSIAQTEWSSTTTTPVPAASVSVPVASNGTTANVRHIYTITCTNSAGSASDSVVVDVLASNAPALDLTINGVPGPITVDPGTRVTVAWTTQNIQDGTCTKSNSLSTDSGWLTPAIIPYTPIRYTSNNSTAITANYGSTRTTATTYTISNCRPVGSTTALPSKSVTVNMYVPSCRVVGPASPSISAGTGGSVSGTVNYGVVWDHTSSFYTATLVPSSTSTPTGFSGTRVPIATSDCHGSFSLSGGTTTAPYNQCSGVRVTGTVPATPSTPNYNISIGATATGTLPAGVSATCTPAILEIVPPGGVPLIGTGGTGASTVRRAPWQEF